MTRPLLIALLLWPAVACAAPLDVDTLLAAIKRAESGGSPYCQGAVRVETLPSGELTIAHGCYQILATTLHEIEPGTDPAWLANDEAAERVARAIITRCRVFYPYGGALRIAYCWRAGLRAAWPARRWASLRYARRVAADYERAIGTPTITGR